MKKAILLSMLFVSLIFTSCSKDSEDSDNVDDPQEDFNAAEFRAKLAGTWQLESRMVNSEPWNLDDCEKQTNIAFTPNNTDYNSEIYEFDENECTLIVTVGGTYEISPDKPDKELIWKNDINSSILVYTYELSDTTLKFTSSEVNGEIVVATYKKK